MDNSRKTILFEDFKNSDIVKLLDEYIDFTCVQKSISTRDKDEI